MNETITEDDLDAFFPLFEEIPILTAEACQACGGYGTVTTGHSRHTCSACQGSGQK